MNSPAEIVHVQNVSMQYQTSGGKTVDALTAVDLTVRRSEFVSLIGPSGCGKSTLLHIMGGMRRATTGTVELDGREVSSPHPDEIGFVFQDYTLLPWRSVRSNVEFALQVRQVPTRQRKDLARQYLDLVGLSSFADAYPAQLSGGMPQRVAIARALCTQPKLLLMDEPFGALDEQTRMVLGEELSRILEQTGVTIVFVTHSLSEAVYLADRIVVMSARPGRILEVIDVPEPRPRAASFMTSPAFNSTRNHLFGLLHDQVQVLATSATDVAQ